MSSAPLLDTLRNQLTPELLSRTASQLGESESVVSKALFAAIPALLAALIAKISDGSFLRRLFGMLSSSSLDSGTLANPSNLLAALDPGASSPLGQLGREFLSSALGGQTRSVADIVASASGASPGAATSLLSLAAPLVLGTLARRTRSDGLDASGLASLLLGQKSAILAAAPPGIAALFGDDLRRAPAATAAPVREAAGGASRWLWAIALLIGVLALWSMLRNREPERPVATAPTPPPVAAPPQAGTLPPVAAPAPAAAGLVRRTLPGGAEISMPKGSLEESLIVLIEGNAPLGQTAWIDFDRLLFETGSATLQPSSREQLRNVAAILVAYPSAKAKIGGYTDDVGDDAANLSLSQARATSVRSELIALGVAAERLEAEGYGEQHPLAPNDSEEGRAQNRRISLLVLER